MYRECFLLFVINNQRGIKIAHFSFLLWPGLFVSFFVPMPKTAPCALNSKFKSLCISGRPAGEEVHTRMNRDLPRLISENVKCLLWPYMGFASPPLPPFAPSFARIADISADSNECKRISRRRNISIMFYKTSHILFLLLAQIREMSISPGSWILASPNIFTTPSIVSFCWRLECLLGLFRGLLFAEIFLYLESTRLVFFFTARCCTSNEQICEAFFWLLISSTLM